MGAWNVGEGAAVKRGLATGSLAAHDVIRLDSGVLAIALIT
jgi:hypothetical protein